MDILFCFFILGYYWATCGRSSLEMQLFLRVFFPMQQKAIIAQYYLITHEALGVVSIT
jgi:hypothetical protein